MYKRLLDRLEFFFADLAVRGWVPDAVVRKGIRTYLSQQLLDFERDGIESQQKYFEDFVNGLRTRAIAENTEKANDQHYEVPAALYLTMLGENLKYSCCLWDDSIKNQTLEDAEISMLSLYCERAQLNDLKPGSTVLDLGCGWGSCALFIAKKYPNLKITCISNSLSQQEFIRSRAQERGIQNLTPMTNDINVMQFDQNSFDRVISIEMFEHMKNYPLLLSKISTWLKPDGKLFVHIFTHKQVSYHFDQGWMASTFFTGGTMPGKDLLLRFCAESNFKLAHQWAVNGKHYSKTLEAWLKKIDKNRAKFDDITASIYGEEKKLFWTFNWRLFNIACSELFNYNSGNEWFVSHYLFENIKLDASIV